MNDFVKSRDLVRKPIGLLTLWVLPVVLAMLASIARLPVRLVAFVWAGAFVWMGLACLLNALRCSRLHCAISAPVLLLASAAVAAIGVGVLPGSAIGIVVLAAAGMVLA